MNSALAFLSGRVEAFGVDSTSSSTSSTPVSCSIGGSGASPAIAAQERVIHVGVVFAAGRSFFFVALGCFPDAGGALGSGGAVSPSPLSLLFQQ